MQKLIIMVGQPSVGKSTTVNSMGGDKNNYVISRNDIVMQVAKENGLSYNELFLRPLEETPIGQKEKEREKYGKKIEVYDMETTEVLYCAFECIDKLTGPQGVVQQRMNQRIKEALNQPKDIIVDMTMLTANERITMIENITKDKDITNLSIEAKIYETKTLRLFEELSEEQVQIKLTKIKNEFTKKIYGPFEHHVKVMENRADYLKSIQEDPKEIPPMVLVMMALKYEMPKKEEGFHKIEVIKVDHSKFEINENNQKRKTSINSSNKNLQDRTI